MRCAAFDSKDFRRDNKKTASVKSPYRGFYTPLGVGVVYDDPDAFKKDYLDVIRDVSGEFLIPEPRRIYSSSTIKSEMGFDKGIAFAQEVINKLHKHVSKIHVSYVILPPNSIPEVSVGGKNCPEIVMRTEEFLRNLGPMFSYISAWNYLRSRKNKKCQIVIDSFRSKKHTCLE